MPFGYFFSPSNSDSVEFGYIFIITFKTIILPNKRMEFIFSYMYKAGTTDFESLL